MVYAICGDRAKDERRRNPCQRDRDVVSGRSILEVPDLLLLVSLFLYVILLWWMDRRFEGRRFYVASLVTAPGMLIVSWVLMKYGYLWLQFPPFWAALVVVVPGLEVTKLVRVNWDLDRKIDRLSSGWLTALNWYEPEWPESGVAAGRRARLLSRPRRNARWKLDAIDFFNDELMRYLSFNNAILASIEDVIIVCDREGRVVYQNPAAKNLGEYHENPGRAAEYLSSLLDGREFKLEPSILHSVPARDGKTFYNVTVTPISTAGVVLSLHDATAQHELNLAKSEMVSLVSHELRTPLTSIRGYSEMLLKYNLVQEKGRDFLGTIIDESSRLNQLIQSFLDIAYIESGRQKITKSDFEIGPVLQDMATVVAPVAGEKQMQDRNRRCEWNGGSGGSTALVSGVDEPGDERHQVQPGRDYRPCRCLQWQRRSPLPGGRSRVRDSGGRGGENFREILSPRK